MQSNLPKLLFMHLPKNGGRTLHTILDRIYPPEKTFTIRVIDNHRVNRNEFIQMNDHHRGGIDLVKGHMTFGLHKLMSGDPKYITLLRSPRERVISYYYYVLMRKKHRLHERLVKDNMTLHDFIINIDQEDIHNCQIRRISGLNSSEDEMIKLAMKNIETHFAFVGFTEYFDESLVLLQNQYSWPALYYEITNKTKKRPLITEVDAMTLAAIDERNLGDQQLYDGLLPKFLAHIKTQPEFNKQLARLNKVNKIYTSRPARFMRNTRRRFDRLF